MRRIFNLFAVLLCATRSIAAQPEPPVSIGFMNAVSLPGKTDVRIDGSSLKPAGFPEGNFVESVGLPAGAHAFIFSNGDCVPLMRDLDIKPDAPALYILYNVAIPKTDGTVKQTLKLAGFPSPHSKVKHFYAYYVSENATTKLRANGATLNIESLKLTPIDGGALTIEVGADEPEHYQPVDPGHYVLVIFDSSDQQPRRVLIQLPE